MCRQFRRTLRGVVQELYSSMIMWAAVRTLMAEAVRGMLDRAEAEFKEALDRGGSAPGTPAQKRRRGIA